MGENLPVASLRNAIILLGTSASTSLVFEQKYENKYYFFKTSWIHFLWKSSLSVSCLRASSGDCHTTGTFLSWSLRCRSRCRMTCRGSRVMVRDCHGCDVLGWLFIHFSRSLAVTINRGDRSEVRGQGLPRMWRTGLALHPLLPQSSRHCK